MLLANAHTLACGLRIRLRLPLASDARALTGLLHRLGLDAGELEVRRALRFDPRRGTTVVATGLVDGREVLLGLASGGAEADTVLAADPEVAALLRAAVRERARVRAA